ncbi:MAG: 2-oxoglutarate/2-oxoacid ferredoxin oxidoreductase subunit alpha [Clostridiales bacterium]|nr:2-oxoglutarate/2-oxoacid ferredoxin oxidoreductase subunit alpha [Clostridiales bacterium]
MAQKVLIKGTEAIGEAAIMAGCRHFFGYPITPQNEVAEYISKRMPEVGGCFLQAESELAAINMVYGAAGAGARVMTSSSSPGISLMQEGISYIAASELPCLIVNVMRGGPGLGGIQPSQADYFQATKGGGHGDYRLVVLAPSTIQEMIDLIVEGFDIADQYRNPVMILADGMLGQMMEPVVLEPEKRIERRLPVKDWATTGCDGSRPRNVINSLFMIPEQLEQRNLVLIDKYKRIEQNEVQYEAIDIEGADVVLVAYGTMARIARTVAKKARELGISVGILRPVTLWPFPYDVVASISDMPNVKAVFSIEMSAGQMVEDIKLGINGKKPVYFYGRTGGMIPSPNEILDYICDVLEVR